MTWLGERGRILQYREFAKQVMRFKDWRPKATHLFDDPFVAASVVYAKIRALLASCAHQKSAVAPLLR